jgi:acyl-CoA synthetase (AMP-forming)/AMP-acid ligase II
MSSFNLADLFEQVVDTVPDSIAMICEGKSSSYRELDQRANQLAHHMESRGIGAGDHVGVYAFNRAEWVESLWACFKLRAVPININYRYVEEELRYIFDNADLKMVIFERCFSPLLDGIWSQLPLLGQALVIEDGSEDKPAAFEAALYEKALSQQPSERGFGERSGDDLYMLYTGGTTGMPKGTMWRQEDIFFAALQGGNPGGEPIAAPHELAAVVLANENPYAAVCPAPIMHGGGAWYCMIFQLSGNCFVPYCPRHFDAGELLTLVADSKATNLIIVGDSMGRPMAEAIATGQYDTSNLFVIGSGGAILSASVKNELKRLLPNAFIMDSFGASETGSGGIVMDIGEDAAGPRFTLSNNVAIIDEETLQPLIPGSPVTGLLARRGHIPMGYFKDEEKTAATFKTDAHGVRWVIPGDYARVLEDGTAELLGRGSVCINSGGEKIFPEEVEAALKAHPHIYDAGVIGLPDERFGARVVAIIQTREGQQLELDEVSAFCRTKIAGYKCPRELLHTELIPRTPVHKPDYRKLKKFAEENTRAG